MKKITLARIVQRLTKKLRLQEYSFEPFLLSETVVPTLGIDELLKTPKIVTKTIAIGGTGYNNTDPVPDGKRYRVKICNIYLSTGTYTFDKIAMYDQSEAANMDLDSFTAATTRVLRLEQEVLLDEKDYLRVNIDAYTGPGNCVFKYYADEEDVF